jgi:hypothetical protein
MLLFVKSRTLRVDLSSDACFPQYVLSRQPGPYLIISSTENDENDHLSVSDGRRRLRKMSQS